MQNIEKYKIHVGYENVSILDENVRPEHFRYEKNGPVDYCAIFYFQHGESDYCPARTAPLPTSGRALAF